MFSNTLLGDFKLYVYAAPKQKSGRHHRSGKTWQHHRAEYHTAARNQPQGCSRDKRHPDRRSAGAARRTPTTGRRPSSMSSTFSSWARRQLGVQWVRVTSAYRSSTATGWSSGAAAAIATICWASTSSGVARHDRRLDRALAHPPRDHRALQQVAAELGEDPAAADVADRVAGAADPLQAARHRLGRLDLDHEVDGAHVDARARGSRWPPGTAARRP